jgi:ABC-type multidrug transport system fused ATPase/permease subunit
VDTETEFLIRDAMKKVLKGRTSIIIAHRLSTIKNVDRIIVLHKGRVRETGSHEELLKMRGMYYKLYELQYREQEENEKTASV